MRRVADMSVMRIKAMVVPVRLLLLRLKIFSTLLRCLLPEPRTFQAPQLFAAQVRTFALPSTSQLPRGGSR